VGSEVLALLLKRRKMRDATAVVEMGLIDSAAQLLFDLIFILSCVCFRRF
jgi:hypothetical protein